MHGNVLILLKSTACGDFNVTEAQETASLY